MTTPPSPLAVVIVEDEPLARNGLVKLIASDPELTCVATASRVESAIAAVTKFRPAILLLDVQLEDGTGLDVLRALGPAPPTTVFVTAYDRYAMDAFDACALDYVLKPFDDERLERALDRAKRSCREAAASLFGQRVMQLLEAQGRAPEAMSMVEAETAHVEHARHERERTSTEAPLTRLAIKVGERIHFVRANDIDWIEADDYYARIHTKGTSFLLRESLTALEAKLDRTRFFRAHRSAIVNVDRVQQLRPSLHGEHTLILHDGTRVRLTRARRRPVEALLRQAR